MKMSLVDIVQADINNFLANNKELLFNERDLQIHMAMYLKELKEGTGYKYQDVDLEYYVPCGIFGNKYIWQNELKIDIVVFKDGVYCPIELKYKTKAVKEEPELIRFGESLLKYKLKEGERHILKNQAAQNLGMYNFWKDVRRVELLKNTFNAVPAGICVFMTNDRQYLNSTNETSDNYNMSMCEGEHGRSRHWLYKDSGCAKTNVSFELDHSYHIKWQTVSVKGIPFYYTSLIVR